MTGPQLPPGPTAARAGQLLVATPALVDPNFERTVVLLLDHDETGSLGVVLNRPTGVEVGAVLPDWAGVAVDPPMLFQGGPVGPDSAIAVAVLGPDVDDPVGYRPLLGRLGLLDLDTPVEVLAPALAGLRIFAGYAGWGEGQLDAEIEEGSWLVVDAELSDVLADDPAHVRRDVLRRQPGELAWLATLPADPTLN